MDPEAMSIPEPAAAASIRACSRRMARVRSNISAVAASRISSARTACCWRMALSVAFAVWTCETTLAPAATAPITAAMIGNGIMDHYDLMEGGVGGVRDTALI
jgi:hypothetical protein